MSALLLFLLLLLIFLTAGSANLGPTYVLRAQINVSPSNRMDREANDFATMDVFSNISYYEWEGYDGWFNNLAHPEWGGAGVPAKKITEV